jgi:hypothetical protein
LDDLGRSSCSLDAGSSGFTEVFVRQNMLNFEGLCWLTIGKQRIYLSGQLKKWLPKMSGDVLAIWIKTFGLVELTETSVYTSIP